MEPSIYLQINGIKNTAFKNIKVNRYIDKISGSFEFIATDKENFPFNINDECVVIVNDTPIITGFIEKKTISYSSNNHEITLSGRDRTADVIDSRLGKEIEFNSPISLKQIIEKTLSIIGITNIKVLNNTEIKNFSKNELINNTEVTINNLEQNGGAISAGYGKNAFNFLELYARKRQVLLTTDGLGNIVITRSSQTPIETRLINQFNGDNNNILSAEFKNDVSKRFHSYIFKSVSNINNNVINLNDNVKNNTNIENKTTDSEIRNSRIFNKITEKNSDLKDTKNRAVWEKEIRRVRGFNYNIDVVGFLAQDDGLVWQPNMLVYVYDNYAGLDDFFLINSVEYKIDLTGGSITTLDFVQKDAYTFIEE